MLLTPTLAFSLKRLDFSPVAWQSESASAVAPTTQKTWNPWESGRLAR
jgi:hypothetical protein